MLHPINYNASIIDEWSATSGVLQWLSKSRMEKLQEGYAQFYDGKARDFCYNKGDKVMQNSVGFYDRTLIW
uniref:Uncharacterized protein n=1 Tax=Romanomermis culicivorax TaxID=13658 RepID=A0A915IZW5_ROMCU